MGSLPIELLARPLHASLTPGEPITQDVLIRLDIADVADRVRPDLAAVLVIDTSSSMNGVPIEQVKHGARRLAEILGDDDSVGIVQFANDASVVSPIRRLDRPGRGELRRAIDALAADGSTHMSAGLTEAAGLFPGERGDRRFVALLMSDGQANVGVSSPDGLAAATAALKERGIGTSTLGFGAHHHEDTLVAIADAGGGRYAFVSDPRLADAELARAIGAQRDIVAEDVYLILRPAPGVEIVRVLGNPPTSFSAGGLKVQLADGIAGDQINAIVELAIEPPSEIGPWRALEIIVAARPVGAAASELAGAIEIDVSRIDGGRGIDLEVARFAAIARAGEARAEARALADRGNFAGAAELLREARDRLAATPGFDRDGDGPLVDAFEALTDDITAMENRPDPEAYASYRKSQLGYADFAAGGIKGRTQTALAGSASEMATAAQRGPLPRARLIARRGGAAVGRFELDRPDMMIGRGSDNEISLRSSFLSRRHSRIKLVEGSFWIFDLGSTNGTWINGREISTGTALENGDLIAYGDLELIYEIGDSEG